MNAVMKPHPIPLVLAEILTVHDQLPEDFYQNTDQYEAQLDLVISTGQSLVHEASEEGRKSANADAAQLRKYAKTYNCFSLSVYKSLTEKATSWRERITSKTKTIEGIADEIKSRFAEMEQKKLATIHTLIADGLSSYRAEIGVRPDFCARADISHLIKLSSLTPGGKLTSTAMSFIKKIAAGNLSRQQQNDKRILEVENLCLKADINPALTKVHFLDVWEADDETFYKRVNDLINDEVIRRAELVAKIEKQNAAENQRKIDQALKDQQDEADRIARGQAMADSEKKLKEETSRIAKEVDKELDEPKQTPESLRKTADHISQAAQYADRNSDRNAELAGAAKLRQQADELEKEQPKPVVDAGHSRTVIITAIFEFKDITDKTSNEGVKKFFRGKLPEQMLAKLSKVSCINA